VRGAGLIGGIDTQWSPGLAIGLAVSYSNAFLKQKDAASGTLSVPRATIYGSWWRGPFAIDALIGAGIGEINSDRPIQAEISHAKRNANEKVAAVQASLTYDFDGWVLSPAVGTKYLNLHETSGTEKGSSLYYNLIMASATANSVRPYGAIEFSKRFLIGDHWSLVPDIRFTYEHEVEDKAHKQVVQTENDAQSFFYWGMVPGANTMRVTGKIMLETSRDMAFYVNYDHMQSDTTKNETVTGGFRYRL
jgi:uncharacterized protein with beta-barrel porin domain